MSTVTSDGVLEPPAAPPDAVVRYADHSDGVVDLHLPETPGPHPLVVLVHGGFWRQAHDRRHVRPLARALVDLGHVVAVPEYRRVGPLEPHGGWPATGDDVRAAYAALPGLLRGLDVEVSTTVLAGHSAGGQLALWLACQHAVPPPDRVVALGPVADLRAGARARLGDGAVHDLLGGGPEAVPVAYDDADPMGLLDRADPATALVMVHGTHDDVVPVEHSRGVARRHPRVTLLTPEADHFAVIDPQSAAWPGVLAALSPARTPGT